MKSITFISKPFSSDFPGFFVTVMEMCVFGLLNALLEMRLKETTNKCFYLGERKRKKKRGQNRRKRKLKQYEHFILHLLGFKNKNGFCPFLLN